MAMTAAERELETLLTSLRAERARLDLRIADVETGLRALRGASDSRTAQIVALLRQSTGAMTRGEIASSLGLEDDERDKLSRLLTYLSSPSKRQIRRSEHRAGGWEIVPRRN